MRDSAVVHGCLRTAVTAKDLDERPERDHGIQQKTDKEKLRGALYGERYRVIVTTDIGGSDPDDFQSMVHYLLYSDLFDTEGLVSSAWGDGRKADILSVIDAYEMDYPALRACSPAYPAPDALRTICRQGAVDFAPWKGWSVPTEGSRLIIDCARKPDPRPLYLLMWGLLEDLAQALHDAPDIAPKLRVIYIGGPNKKWGPNAYAYIRRCFPDLWIIENNSAYRGWFCGGYMERDYGNESCPSEHIARAGALGAFFMSKMPAIKMGDTPTVAYLLYGDPEDPTGESWGGSFERVRNMPCGEMEYPFAAVPCVETFSVNEVCFRAEETEPTEKPVFDAEIRGQHFEGFSLGSGIYAFRFVPKETGDFAFVIRSRIAGLDGLTGTVRVTEETKKARSEGPLTSWYSDRLEPELSEGPHKGAKTVSKWRKAYLDSFRDRLERCLPGRPDGEAENG